MSEVAERTREQEEFQACIDEFLRYLKGVRNDSDNTVRAYGADLASYMSWVEREGVHPFEVTHRELRGYLAELTQAGYASKTINRHLSALRMLYRWLIHEGKTTTDAAAALASPKLSRTLPATMSNADVEKLFATCDDTPEGLRDRAFLELLYASGARISEASALDVGDVDFAQGQLRLFGKGSKERIVPLYEAALGAARHYLSDGRPRLLADHADPGALFVSTRGRRMSADALRTSFEAHVAQAGLDPSLTPHAMRHTYATELLAGGADLRSVQELLGHESLSTTQIYTHLSVGRLQDAMRQAHPRSGSQD